MLFDHVLTQKMYTYFNKWIQLVNSLQRGLPFNDKYVLYGMNMN